VLDSAKLLNPYNKKIQDLKVSKVANRVGTARPNKQQKLKDDIQKHLNKAVKLFSANKLNESYKEFEKASQLNKNNMEIVVNMAVIDIRLNRYDAAIAKLTKVINTGQIKTGKPEYNRGRCYLKKNQKKLAGIDFRASLDKGFHLAKKLDKRILAY